jgi:TonB family protein
MIRLNIMKTAVLPLALLSAALATPAYANWFFDPISGIARNVGSAPNPTPQDLRQNRSAAYPLISRARNEQGTVGLRISLTASGAVSGAVVERTSGFQRLDDAAVNYVMARWPYRPTAQDREGIPSEMLVDVTFRLG